MSLFAIQQGLLGFVRLLTTAAVAGWVGSPMSWSPDARWLSYTVEPDPAQVGREPGWLFGAPRGAPGKAEHPGDGSPNSTAGAAGYRIWASQRDGGASVLVAESTWPLTAPAWSPQGRSMAYGRFVPESMDAKRPWPRGRLEVVIQDGLDRKRVLLVLPALELDEEARARFPHLGPAWSPDGQYLAMPRPGRIPAILVIKVDSRKVLRTLDRALLPAWSPDGTKLAYIHQDDADDYSLQIVERRGQTIIGARAILPTGRVAAPVAWAGDGRSLFAVIERAGPRSADLDLARIAPETGDAVRVFKLVPEIPGRGARIRGVAIDFDRDEDLCFSSIDFEGRDTDVCWSIPREGTTYKRLYPLDQSLRVGSIAIAPDGHSVAMRFGTPGGLSLPAVYGLSTERTTLIVPDEASRRAWLNLLVRTARSLLDVALPPALMDGKAAERPTPLPLPDEIPPDHPLHPRSRLAHLARFGSDLCATSRTRGALAARPETETEREDRLFFDYLRGDYAAAAVDLECLEPQATTPEQRLVLLGLRAQILWAQGDTDRAREVASYLLDAIGRPIHRVEETPIGRTLVPESGSGRTWARYLAARVSQPLAPPAPIPGPPPIDRDDPMIINPFAPPAPPGIEFQRDRIPGAPVPFAPDPPPPPRPIDARPLRSR